MGITDVLVPACGGSEKPFVVNGRRWLYCWHPQSGRHCYLDVENDRPVWHRRFHPAFNPEFEFAEEEPLPAPIRRDPEPKEEEPEDFYW